MLLPMALLTGCAGDPPPVDFGDPAQLGPLEAVNLAPEVEGTPGDPFPEALAFTSGEDTENDRWFAHARGWVHADCGAVWEALRVHDVMVDRRAVDEWTVEDNPLPEFDFSFLVHNTVFDLVTIRFDLTWVHELQEGSVASPELVVVRWDKTDGSGFIDLLSGSVVLRGVDDGLCEIELIEHLRAPQRDDQTLVQYLTDLHAELVATVRGEALPVYGD